MDTTRVDEDQADAPRVRKPRWLIVAALLVALYTIPAAFTASPKACATCHAMKPYYQTWHASRHRAAASDCLYCHAKPGIVQRALYRPTLYWHLFSAVSGGKIRHTASAGVSDEACTRSGCHGMNRLSSLSGELQINHRLHATEAEMSCIDCHRGAGHGDLGGRSSNPPMKLCEPCHADVMDKCRYCHISNALPNKK